MPSRAISGCRAPAPKMVVTDLDGTLLDRAGNLSGLDRATLERLGQQGFVRVIATGRTWYSAARLLPPDLPIDYLVFSSGAGIVDWPDQALLAAHHLSRHAAVEVAAALIAEGADFMLHRAIPDNHHFHFFGSGKDNADFGRRCEANRALATPWADGMPPFAHYSQLLVVEPAAWPSRGAWLSARFPALKVIRTTSPLDGASRWIEVFPAAVSKARGAEWIAARHAVARDDILVVGNDYNDEDMLGWARHAYVVANAPAELRRDYLVVGSNEASGFTDAVAHWRAVEEASSHDRGRAASMDASGPGVGVRCGPV